MAHERLLFMIPYANDQYVRCGLLVLNYSSCYMLFSSPRLLSAGCQPASCYGPAMAFNPAIQEQNQRSAILFMQQEHANTLQGLHSELGKLQKKYSGDYAV